MKSVTLKLGNMRKAVDWTIYPKQPEHPNLYTIQSSSRICAFDATLKKGRLSKHCSSGAYFIHLNKALGVTEIDIPDDVISAVKNALGENDDNAN